MGRLAGRRALLIVAHAGFREEELDLPRRALEAAGAEVAVASSATAPASGMGGGQAFPDLLYCAARPADYDAVVFVGGTGAAEFFPDRTAHGLAREALAQGKVVGAICFAGSILAEAGLLEGRRATAFPSRRPHLEARGAVWTGAPATTDGDLVTGRGPEDAQAFADALVAAVAAKGSRAERDAPAG